MAVRGVFKVGGCIRDEMLGVRTKDIDFAVECDSFAELVEFVQARCKKVFEINEDHLTVRGMEEGVGVVDFVATRSDGRSLDGRHCETRLGTIEEDLDRRDFTVNAMARNVATGEFLDRHDGVGDLNRMILRFVGNAEDRLAHDALRAFRAMRFAVTKDFTLADETVAAVRNMRLDDFHAVSSNRVRDELFKCFAHNTELTLLFLAGHFEILLRVMLDRGIKLEPTLGQMGVK